MVSSIFRAFMQESSNGLFEKQGALFSALSVHIQKEDSENTGIYSILLPIR